MRLHRVSYADPVVEPLLAELGGEYERRYGPNDELARAVAEDFEPPSGLFVVVLDADGDTVAGGGFRRLEPGVCEVKRMWTSPAHRRAGLATRVLVALEDGARGAGYAVVRLVTGHAQPEAVALYQRRGYRPIEPWGPYEQQGLAFEKSLPAFL